MGSLPDPNEQPCVTLDQVIRRRAATHADHVLISYPANESSDFVDYTGADLERLTRLAATQYGEAFAQLDEDTRPSEPSGTVAIVGVSNLEYYITFLALQRLGLSSMFISPRLADQGFTHLLQTAGCKVVVASGPSRANMERISQSSGLQLSVMPMLDMDFLSNSSSHHHHQSTKPLAPFDDEANQQRFIIHSGGTTGLPKPVPLLARSWLLQAANLAGRMPRVLTLSTLPLFHSFGLATLLRSLVNGKRLSLLSAARPVTAAAVLAGLDATNSQALVTVPYVLKFLVEAGTEAKERLGWLEQVVAAGSAVPDALGDELVVGAGVKLFHLYGLTECGALMEPSSTSDPITGHWNWVTPLPDAEPFLKFELVSSSSPLSEAGEEDHLYHLVVLPGLKAKVFSDRPDGSYATKDLFRRHPTVPRRWKFVARLDDMVVLVNGEKADPVPLEEAVGRNPNVAAAVVFGTQRDSLGMLVVASDRAAGLNKEEIVRSILPDLELGNARVPAYAKVAPDAVIVKEAGTQFPCTDKATVIRSLFLKQFAADIEGYYAKREQANDVADGPLHVVAHAAIRDLVRQTVRGELRLGERGADLTDKSDFFALGMDSLQATNVRSRLLKQVSLGGRSLTTNVVFDHPSVELLSSHLLDVRAGVENGQQSAKELAMQLVEKYSSFEPPAPGVFAAEKEVVLLTGATGALGSHILALLLLSPTITTIHCLVRAADGPTALSRIHAALAHSHLLAPLPPSTLSAKLRAHPCDLSSPSPNLGLPTETFAELRASTTRIIHAAWVVDFNRALRSFDAACLRPTHALLELTAASECERKPTFVFVSSIAAALRAEPGVKPEVSSSPPTSTSSASSPALSSSSVETKVEAEVRAAAKAEKAITESLHPWEAVAPEMGYGQSKWVAERMCAAAAAAAAQNLDVRVLRVGQLCGDRAHGVWNAAEAVPATVQAALTVGALPVVDSEEELAWLPVDVAARAAVELGFAEKGKGAEGCRVWHVVNERRVRWNGEFLPALRRAGLGFEAVPQREWVQRLERSEQDAEKNPPVKLLEFFRRRYGAVGAQAEPVFDMTEARKFAPSLREGTPVDEELVGKFVRFWTAERRR